MSVKERILIAICGIGLGLGVANAQVIVHAGPPPPIIVERPGPPLHAGWVWVPGHYRWYGGRYVWVRGSWVNPPRRGAVWIPGPLGASRRRLCLHRRILALARIESICLYPGPP
jgi:hypothetical protein